MNVRLERQTLLLGLFFLFPLPLQASIILSEVQVTGDKAADEFVELYNTGSDAVNLSGFSLRRKSQSDATAKGSSLKTFSSSDTIPAHGYFLWASSAGIFKDIADTTTTGGLSDNNSVSLFDKNSAIIEALTWGTGHLVPFTPASFENPDKKESFTRDLESLNWSRTKSPSPINSKGETWKEPVPEPPTPKPFTQIVINEVFPNPKEKGDQGEFIELYNPLSSDVDLSGWEIHDASTSGKYIFPSGKKIEAKEYLVITDKDFTLSLNNSNETLALYDSEKRVVHTVHYDKTKEGVTLNLVDDKLKGGKVPTPGKVNILNNDPVTKEKVPKKGFVDIAVPFRAKGSDQDGDTLKYTWDFGDKHKSYKAETTHKYTEVGEYTVTLTTDDGTDTTTETFLIRIEKYEAPKLRIVALMPNPKGKDSDLEWIEIENREKKSVNLKGFSIATGAKKKSLVNHPIRENFILKGKSVKRITREESLFTLNNKNGFVELRAPNGEVIHRLKYKFDKSLKDNVILKKDKGKPVIAETLLEIPEPESEEVVSPQVPETNTTEVISSSENVTFESNEDILPPEVKGESTVVDENQTIVPTEIKSTPHWWSVLNSFFNTLLNWSW